MKWIVIKQLAKNQDSALLTVALILLIAALFKPTIGLKRDLHNYLFVVDVTQSMNTADMHSKDAYISRLAYTRLLMKDAVAQLPCGTNISLSVFSAESVALLFTPIEVCKNYDVIQDSIAHLEWRMAWRGNSRLRFGMQSVTAILSSLPTPAQVVFFTDGDEAPKLNATNKTDLSGWQGGQDWIIAGIGGDEPFPIPKLDSENKVLGYWAYSNSIMAPSQVISEDSVGTRDDSIATDDYNRYLSKLEDAYLQELAGEIGAKYIRANSTDSLINAMQAQKPAGYDTTRFAIDGLLILAAMCLVLAQYRRNFIAKLKSYSSRYFVQNQELI
ncbi:MAG TPA: VWA domain-containing protein [Methylotenera sp.]|nr:VWA domain-containing protein [Methylotenera sp.]